MTLITITKWDANYMNMSMVSETESIMHSHSSVIHYKDQAELETAFNAASAVSSIIQYIFSDKKEPNRKKEFVTFSFHYRAANSDYCHC